MDLEINIYRGVQPFLRNVDSPILSGCIEKYLLVIFAVSKVTNADDCVTTTTECVE